MSQKTFQIFNMEVYYQKMLVEELVFQVAGKTIITYFITYLCRDIDGLRS